jgi:hypothetical protein
MSIAPAGHNRNLLSSNAERKTLYSIIGGSGKTGLPSRKRQNMLWLKSQIRHPSGTGKAEDIAEKKTSYITGGSR